MTNICPVCHKERKAKYIGGECSSECFSKGFWLEKVAWKNNGDVVDGCKCARISGSHYVIHPDVTSGMMGFGGRKMAIRFTSGPHAGQTVVTKNLWHQGEIPQWCRAELPDNAGWGEVGE